jgi:hypothetical protein
MISRVHEELPATGVVIVWLAIAHVRAPRW